MKNLKRNFEVKRGQLCGRERLAVLRIVNQVLSKIESCPGEDIDKIIRYADCPGFQHYCDGAVGLMPAGDSDSETTGFVVQGSYEHEGQWWTTDICTIYVPALAKLTRRAA